jgi:hypothetical protein
MLGESSASSTRALGRITLLDGVPVHVPVPEGADPARVLATFFAKTNRRYVRRLEDAAPALDALLRDAVGNGRVPLVAYDPTTPIWPLAIIERGERPPLDPPAHGMAVRIGAHVPGAGTEHIVVDLCLSARVPRAHLHALATALAAAVKPDAATAIWDPG